MSIESVTVIEDSGFKIEKTESINRVSNANTRLELQIFMNRDVVTVKR